MENQEDLADGLLVINRQGFGFLRMASNSYAASDDDVFVSADKIRLFQLRPADRIMGRCRPPSGDQRHRSLVDILQINKQEPSKLAKRPYFDDLTPTYPDSRIHLEYDPKNLSTRIVDLVTPIGRGQRCLIVAPPRAGKTHLLQDLALAIQKNHPEIILVVLLIDERPEEVTDMREVVNGEVIASTFDEQPERHVEVAEVVIERARRLAEMKGHVVVLLDSITRLARAYNTITPASGRVMSGGLDARSLPAPKKIFGAARNLRNAGSITIIGTALVDTGSKMDDVIFEEFKGTGNSEIHLDRRLMDKRIFPCIDIQKSGTRKEELLMDDMTKKRIWAIRSTLAKAGPVESMEALLSFVAKYPTNADFIRNMGQ